MSIHPNFFYLYIFNKHNPSEFTFVSGSLIEVDLFIVKLMDGYRIHTFQFSHILSDDQYDTDIEGYIRYNGEHLGEMKNLGIVMWVNRENIEEALNTKSSLTHFNEFSKDFFNKIHEEEC